MEQPLVSVVVVSYNQAQYIIQNLNSLKSQTFTNWELIVADDASPDDSVEVFRDWLRENKVSAKVIFHTKNTGLATVLNEAIELCNGEYVKFIAADDYMHAECLEKSVQCLQAKGKGYGMVFTDTFYIDENNQHLSNFEDFSLSGKIPATEFHEMLIKSNRIGAPTVLMKTDVVKETGKYNAKFIVEDYQRWLMISEKYFITYVPEKLTYYRIHESNISKTKADRILAEDRMLQMMYDHNGIVKNMINHYMQDNYLTKKDIYVDLLHVYSSYPFRKKVLTFCMNNKIPVIIYKIYYSLSLRFK
ncbi:MAG: glycosyltransferase family 2 protein [Lutibacter sp.]